MILKDEFVREVKEKGGYVVEKVQDVKEVNMVKEVGGKGLMGGVECDEGVGKYMRVVREEGLVVVRGGVNVIGLLGGVNVERAEIDQA
ncbi:aminotransferase class III-fold pyridoxal phosphate-dependent enzyme, partial [Bacillus pumilus]|uniref:aminotransferase class III-fold pyridoxal phosphate-dependent enzyme n=1 Tax=Bacillus pumilus TaxID=1408 RepID=UPI0011AA918F